MSLEVEVLKGCQEVRAAGHRPNDACLRQGQPQELMHPCGIIRASSVSRKPQCLESCL